MTTSLFLAVALVALPPKADPKPDAAEPASAVATSAPSSERQAALQGTLAKRKAVKDKKKNAAAQKAARDAAQAKAIADWEAYVGPIVAAQQRADFMLQLEAQRVQALQSMANAAQQEVALARQRMYFQSMVQPQFYGQVQGFVPAPNAAAAPHNEAYHAEHKDAHKESTGQHVRP